MGEMRLVALFRRFCRATKWPLASISSGVPQFGRRFLRQNGEPQPFEWPEGEEPLVKQCSRPMLVPTLGPLRRTWTTGNESAEEVSRIVRRLLREELEMD